MKIDNLLPGWVKPAGKPAHADLYAWSSRRKSTRLDDLSIDGSGVDGEGLGRARRRQATLVSANFPVFNLSEGDKATLKADRGSDGVLRVMMRGDIYDGSNFVKSSLAGAEPEKAKQKHTDLDLDIKLGTVIGRNGETLRGLDLKLTRRGGRISAVL